MTNFDVAIIQTGGTLSSAGEVSLSPNMAKATQIEAKVKDIFALCGLTSQIFYPLTPKLYDSSDISPREWQKIKEQINELQDKGVSKFLILHGTDTMCYTASALSLAVDSCTVVFTGSQRTLDDDDFDGFDNIHLAAEFLAKNNAMHKGVYIAFANEIIPAPFCHKQNASGLKAFCDTRNCVDKPIPDFSSSNVDLSKANLDDVEIIRLNPISMPYFKNIMNNKKYLLIFGFGSGNVPSYFKENLKQQFTNVPNCEKPKIIAASTCEVGLKASFLYDTGIESLSKDGFSVFSQGEFSEEFVITLLALNSQIDIIRFFNFYCAKALDVQ